MKKCVLLGCAKLDLWFKACDEVRAYEMRYNHNHDEKGRFCSGDGVDKGGKGDIIEGERGITSGVRQMANGMRKSYFISMTEEERKHVIQEAVEIGIDPSMIVFREDSGSAYFDEDDVIYISSNVFPSTDDSTHPRDRMSVRAVLAHEYYGHRAHRGTPLASGSWNDEFRASYTAAETCPNLSSEDRRYSVLDAVERARAAGVTINYNDFMRRTIYGEGYE